MIAEVYALQHLPIGFQCFTNTTTTLLGETKKTRKGQLVALLHLQIWKQDVFCVPGKIFTKKNEQKAEYC